MTRRLVDISDYQAGLNVDAVAASVDGAWCKAGDWAWIARYGWPGDDIHNTVVNRFLQLGKPVGSYLFVRPGYTAPQVQIDQWRQHCPDGTTIAPMIDLEVNGTLSGGALRDWVDAALRRVAEVFGVTPVLYWSNTFANAYGMSAPSAPHVPMVAEYHWGYQTQLWANQAGWETHAYSAYGGPDVPPGYSGVTSRSLIWQWTSSAQLPGFLGLVDHDFVPDAAWSLITDAALPPASDTWETFMADNQKTMDALAEFVRVFGTPGNYYLGDVWNRTLAILSSTDVAKYGYKRLDGSPVDTLGLWALNLHERMTADSLNPIAVTGHETLAAVNKLDSGDVDVDAVVAKVVAGIVAAGVHADVDEAAIAKAVLDAFRNLLGGAPVTAVTPEVGELPDSNPNRRAAAALADLETAVFDAEVGIIATVARDVAKMTRTAEGYEPTAGQVHDALLAAGADATRRAAEKARNVPTPPPPLPAPTGDMGGQPNT